MKKEIIKLIKELINNEKTEICFGWAGTLKIELDKTIRSSKNHYEVFLNLEYNGYNNFNKLKLQYAGISHIDAIFNALNSVTDINKYFKGLK